MGNNPKLVVGVAKALVFLWVGSYVSDVFSYECVIVLLHFLVGVFIEAHEPEFTIIQK